MTRALRIALPFLLLALLCPSPAQAAAQSKAFSGLWVATVSGLDYPSVPTTDPAQLKADADRILSDAVRWGITDIFLQVRPADDAIYPSELFPWSAVLTGEAGLPPEDDFDPLAYFIEGAHLRGIALHAWINPYRANAASNPLWIVSCEGKTYLNPALPAVQEHITAGVQELLARYDLDGIHLDDYFYPGKDFPDEESYLAADTTLSKDEWRRENVNTLIRSLSETVAAYPGVQFGVSPFGIWANASTDPRGSATSGSESYTDHYADTRLWVEEGWLDYIAPQIYWHSGHPQADFSTLLAWWSELCTAHNTALYPGLAAYRADDPAQDPAWQGSRELLSQITACRAWADGLIFFRYGALAQHSALAEAVSTALRTEAVAVSAAHTAAPLWQRRIPYAVCAGIVICTTGTYLTHKGGHTPCIRPLRIASARKRWTKW